MDKIMKKAPAIRAFMMAINLRKLPTGLVRHSDREPVCQSCLPGFVEAAWDDLQYELQGKLLGQFPGGAVLQ